MRMMTLTQVWRLVGGRAGRKYKQGRLPSPASAKPLQPLPPAYCPPAQGASQHLPSLAACWIICIGSFSHSPFCPGWNEVSLCLSQEISQRPISHKCLSQWIKIRFLQYQPKSGFSKKVIRPRLFSLIKRAVHESLNKQRVGHMCVIRPAFYRITHPTFIYTQWGKLAVTFNLSAFSCQKNLTKKIEIETS